MKTTLRSAIFAMLWAWLPSAQAATDPLASLITTDYTGKADTLTTCLIRQFLNQSEGTFWAVPRDQSNREAETTYIYWQQAHAMDALVYSYERIKDTKTTTAKTYERYMKAWYTNHANNWYNDTNDPTGFLNEYTDDMCWISLTLLHLTEALGDDKYADMARKLFDDYIVPRGWTDDDGFWGLPWKSNFQERNACTNAPGCLVASKLFLKYGDEKYKDTAIKIAAYQLNEMKTKLNDDGRVEDPPLTYTQGTMAEACRVLYHITGESAYLQMAQKITYYLCSSTRCNHMGLLRHEGESMDQSIFKAVAIPYIVNMALDENVTMNYRRYFIRFLLKNADALWTNLDLTKYPVVYCPYYWGETVDPQKVPSMGAMVSGVSLMENTARMALELTKDETGIDMVRYNAADTTEKVFTLDGRRVGSTETLPKGVYIISGRKVMVR